MRRVFLSTVFAALFLTPLCHGQGRVEGVRAQPHARSPAPVQVVPELVTQMPPDLPQKVSGFAYDGEKFWVLIYQGRGRYATLDPLSLAWKSSESGEQHRVIRQVEGASESPGGACFDGGKLWVAGTYGESLGSIDVQEWEVERLFKTKLRDDPASQVYSSMACDGSHLWVVWHWFNYKLPASQTQLLLKIDPAKGKVVGQYPAPAGTAPDGAHGLTWDGTKLWHMKDSRLSAIDPTTGRVTAQYILPLVTRPSGLAWDGEALWIIEFGGQVWRLRL